MSYDPYQSNMATVSGAVLIDRGRQSAPDNLGVFWEDREHITVGPAVFRLVLQEEFKKHARKWVRDTQFVSSLTDKYLHTSYARIIGMGRPAVPMILERIRQQPGDWFYALRAMTGDNPVKSADAGDMQKMTQAWLDWGREKGLCR